VRICCCKNGVLYISMFQLETQLNIIVVEKNSSSAAAQDRRVEITIYDRLKNPDTFKG